MGFGDFPVTALRGNANAAQFAQMRSKVNVLDVHMEIHPGFTKLVTIWCGTILFWSVSIEATFIG